MGYLTPVSTGTVGAAGAKAFTARGNFTIPAPKAEPFINAIGAGDTFMGTLPARLIEACLLTRTALEIAPETSPHRAIAMSAKAGTPSCRSSGCNPPFGAALQA